MDNKSFETADAVENEPDQGPHGVAAVMPNPVAEVAAVRRPSNGV